MLSKQQFKLESLMKIVLYPESTTVRAFAELVELLNSLEAFHPDSFLWFGGFLCLYFYIGYSLVFFYLRNVSVLLGSQFRFVGPYPYLHRLHEVDMSDFNALNMFFPYI